MRLEDVLQQLEALNQEMAKVQKAQVTVDAQARRLATRYQTAVENTQALASHFQKILPPSVLSRFSQMAGRMQEGVQLAAQTQRLHNDYQQSIAKTVTEWQKLNDAAAEFSADINNAQAHQIVDANKLRRMYLDVLESRERGEHELAASIHRSMLRKMGNELKSGKTLFNSWVTMEKTRLSAAKMQAATSNILRQYEASNTALGRMNRETSAWRQFVDEGAHSLVGIKTELVAIAGLTGFTLLMKSFSKINEALIEANSALKHRYELSKANYFVSLQIGASSEKIADAQKALLGAGQKQLAVDKNRVRTITMLSMGLGVAEDEAAQLALYSDLTGNNFDKVADTLAVIVNKTNLTSREAVKLVSTLTTVQRTLGLTAKSMPEIATSMGAIEGALKGMGGSEGMVGRLMERFSSLKGVGEAVMLGGSQGILNPKDFNNVDRMSQMLQNTGQQLQQLTGGDPLRLAAFEPMLQRMGLTMNDARALMDMSKPEEFAKIAKDIKDANTLRTQTSALEKRYREQQSAAGKQWELLKNQGAALVKMALTPLLKVVTWLMTGVNKLLSGFLSLVNWIESGSEALDTAATWWKNVFRPVTDLVSTGMRMLGNTLAWLATPLTWVYNQFKKVAQVLKPLSSTFAAPVYLAVKAISVLASVAIGGLLVRSLYLAGRSLFGFSRMAMTFAGQMGGARVAGVLRSVLNMAGIGTRATTFSGLWRALSGGIGRFMTGIGPTFGRTLGMIATRVPWGAIASRVALPIAAAVGAFKIGQLGVEAYKLHKAKQQEKNSALALKEQQDRIRQKYNIPAGVDVNKWLHQQVSERSARMQTVPATTAQSSTPFQRQILPQTTMPQTGVSLKSRDAEMTEQQFSKLTSEVKTLQAVVRTGADKQVKVVEKGNFMEVSRDRLHRENEALRLKPVTTYGLETYVR